MYLAASIVEAVAVALLPIWLSTDVSRGGMGYSVPNMALVISAGGIVSFILHSVFKSRMAYVLKSSPVRTLRYVVVVIIKFVVPRFDVNVLIYSYISFIFLDSLQNGLWPVGNSVHVTDAVTSIELRSGVRRSQRQQWPRCAQPVPHPCTSPRPLHTARTSTPSGWN
jgi:hypothetical protein